MINLKLNRLLIKVLLFLLTLSLFTIKTGFKPIAGQAQTLFPLNQFASWFSIDSDDTESIAWGDVDGDGDLDLAVGNGDILGSRGSRNKVYLNENGVLQTQAGWLSGDSDLTRSVAWGDVDGDGDLDLAVGNEGSGNKVYLNENGVLQTQGWVDSG